MAIAPPGPSRQVAFHQFLVSARATWLNDALSATLASVDPNVLKTQISRYVPTDVQQLLAAAGIRDEQIFPTPVVIEKSPALVGYYRLLLDAPRKQFYDGSTGLSDFQTAEKKGILTNSQRAKLDEFCRTMCEQLAELVRQSSPRVTQRDLSELPLLTLGQMLQGRHNNVIGTQAKDAVFLAILEILQDQTLKRETNKLTFTNASGRRILITLAADPDVSVEEDFSGQLEKHVAIEIKGGTDKSNAYIRAGEAEKSHLAAKSGGFREFWTIIAVKGVDTDKLKTSSATTNAWFDVAQVLARNGPDWDEFRRRLAGRVGIPV